MNTLRPEDRSLLDARNANREVLTGDRWLYDYDLPIQAINPGTSNKNVHLPDVGAANHYFVITNTSTSGKTITVISGVITIAALAGGDTVAVVSDSLAWRVISGAATGGGPVIHAIDGAYHTSSATPGQMLKANANGLPANATNTDAEVAAAVSASHTAVTVADTGRIDLALTGQQISADLVVGGVSNSYLADMAANTIKANATAGAAAPGDLAIAANRFPARASTGNIEARTITDFGLSLVDDSDAATARTTLGLGTMATEAAADYVPKSLYDAYTILYADSDNTPAALLLSTSRLVGRGASGGVAAITLGTSLAFSGTQLRRAALTGDVTASADSNTTAIAAGVIVNNDISASAAIALSKLATQAADSFVGNVTSGAAVPTAVAVSEQRIVGRVTGGRLTGLTAAEVRTLINVADGANAYVHPNHTGDVTSAGDGAQTIAVGAVTAAKMYLSAASRLLGRSTAGAGAAEELGVSSPLSITGGNLTHLATAGNIHLPTGGSANQILKNSGSSGTGAWGTVTETAGALAAITTISMSGQLTSTLATGTAPFVVASTTKVNNLHAARATLADTVTVVDAASDTSTWPMLAGSATGDLGPLTDPGLAYNASTNVLTVAGNVIAGAGGGAYSSAASGTLSINVTAAKTLTLTAADNYTLTISATGTAALLETANTFTNSQTINADYLYLNSNTQYTPQIILTAAYTSSAGGYILMRKARGTYSSPTTVSSGDTLGGIKFYGHDGTTYRDAALINATAAAAPSGGYLPGRIHLYTYSAAGVLTEGMRMSAAEVTVNEDGIDLDFRVETDNYNAITVDASNNSVQLMSNAAGKLGFFGATPKARVDIGILGYTSLTIPTYTDPTAEDYTWGGGTLGGYGFSSADEFRSFAKSLAYISNQINVLLIGLGQNGSGLFQGGI